jgi:hypothetical protein
MSRVLLIHIDGKLPNLALMKLAHWHKSQGDEVSLTRELDPQLFDSKPDRVYASTIFTFSLARTERVRRNYPNALIGGTGSGEQREVEKLIGSEYEHYDYSVYPGYPYSIGFTARGCRLSCKFCVVPQKEGKPRSVNTIADIWRAGTEKNVVLLDNDFFGQPKEQWQARCDEIIRGGFKVNFTTGINIRMITDESAEWLSKLPCYDLDFKSKRIYTAWDNLRDEKVFFEGLDRLEKHGVPPNNLMVYMLVGWDKEETWERIFYRFNRLVERGVKPYPMVYNNERKDLKKFQRWVVRRYYQFVPWDEYNSGNWKEPVNPLQEELHA